MGAPSDHALPLDWGIGSSAPLLSSSWLSDWKLEPSADGVVSQSSQPEDSLTTSILLVILLWMTVKWILSRDFYDLVSSVWYTVSAIQTGDNRHRS